MKKLIIAEKPNLAKVIISAIGGNPFFKDYYEDDKYIIISQFGHLLELKSIGDYKKDKERDRKWTLEDLPFFPEKFEYKVKKDSGIKERYGVIKKLIDRVDVDEIINAGDPDREGEVLINIVIYKIFNELHKTKKVSRIWLDPLTEEKVREELPKRKPIKDTENLYKEGLARADLDWLYGINLTEFNTLKVGKLMNTGRVIIPLVRWIYDRDVEIEKFKAEKYYTIISIINKNGKEIKLNFKELRFKENEKDEANNKIKELSNKKIIVSKVENKEIVKEPHKLFSLSTLQSHMFKKEKFTIAKTLQLVQGLYEKGFLTYPRTDTEYLSEDEVNKVKNIIDKQFNDDLTIKTTKNIFNSSKVESHTAIIITTKTPKLDDLSEDEKKVYLTVRNRFYANFCKDKCILNKTIVTFEVDTMKTNLTGTSIKQKGYLKYESDINDTFIPEFKEGEKFIPQFKLQENTTTPPTHLSEADLTYLCKHPFKEVKEVKEVEIEEEQIEDDEDYKKIMEGSMIGTEATRAVMIEKIKKVGYVEVEKNRLIITDFGRKFIETLEKLNINLWKEKTAEMNRNLKKISKGLIRSEEVIREAEKELKQIINQNIEIAKVDNAIGRNIIGKCPICGKRVIENSKAYGCEGYKEGCKFSIWKNICGKKITEKVAKQLLENKKTSLIAGFKSKNGNKFDSYLVLKNNEVKFEFKNK